MVDLSIIYYTSNWLEDKNPHFLENTKKQLIKAIGKFPLVIVSQKPTLFGGNTENVVMGDIGRSHLNIYRQILAGCKMADTDYVAMAEDDILYSESHFHSRQIEKEFADNGDVFLFDMNKLSMFTWGKPRFSFRSKRRVVNQLIAPRQMLIDALEERFKRIDYLMKKEGWSEERVIKYWGDPGRYEGILGVTVRKSIEFYSQVPSIVFSHPEAFGYLNLGKKKRVGDIRIIELEDWGRAEDVLKLYNGGSNVTEPPEIEYCAEGDEIA